MGEGDFIVPLDEYFGIFGILLCHVVIITTLRRCASCSFEVAVRSWRRHSACLSRLRDSSSGSSLLRFGRDSTTNFPSLLEFLTLRDTTSLQPVR